MPKPGGQHCRTVRDYERLPASHEAVIIWAILVIHRVNANTFTVTEPGGEVDTVTARGPSLSQGPWVTTTITEWGRRSRPDMTLCSSRVLPGLDGSN
jgi:hypothetical protein